MDWAVLILIGVLLAAGVVVGAILGIVSFAMAMGGKKELQRLRESVEALRGALGALRAAGPPPRPVEGVRPVGPAAPVAAPAPIPAPVAAPAVPSPVEPGPMVLEPLSTPGATGPSGPPPQGGAVPAGLPSAFAAEAGPSGPPGAVPPGSGWGQPGAVRPHLAPAPAFAPGGAGEPGELESRIGKRWIAGAGVIVLFFGVAFFLKYAFKEWIGPTGQVVVGALAGVAILGVGSLFIQRTWRVLGQCLAGLGLAILYATFFSAFSLYQPAVLDQQTAFAFMAVVTVAGMALAVLHNAVPIAFAAVLGGLLTPWLLSTGHDARDALFTYLMLLDLGVLAVAFFRGWRLLDALALAGTFVLYGGWYSSFYAPTRPAAGLAPALAWLGAFYVVFLALPFVYHLVRRVNFTIERFVMALANAAFAFGLAWDMLREDYSFALGFVALGMAAAYVVLGAIIRRRLPDDARTLFAATAMSVTFLTMAVPLHLRAEGIMLAWAAEGPVLLYLGWRYRYAPVRAFAAAVLAVAVGRLFLSDTHWPMHSGPFVPFATASFLTAVLVPVAMGLFALVHQRFAKGAGATALDRAMKLTAALGGGFIAIVILHAELGGWLEREVSELAGFSAATVVWALGAAAYLAAGAKARPAAGWTWGVGGLALCVAAALGASLFGLAMGREHVPAANVRFGACLLATATFFAYAWVIRRTPAGDLPSRMPAAVFALAAGLVALLALLSAEAYSFCRDVIVEPVAGVRAGQMSITVVWGVFAAGLLVAGFWRRWRPLRLAGLGLFALSALKLVAVDLMHVQDIYRIVSFLVLGMLLVVASYLYHRLEKRLLATQAASDPKPTDGERR
jgi:hypothetical protein